MEITSTDNQRVKMARALHSKKGRDDHGMFIAEGPAVVGEMLMYAPDIEWVAWCENFADSDGDELADAAAQAGLTLLEMSKEAFEKISDTQTPQGIAAVVRIPEHQLTDITVDRLASFAILHDLRDPGNLGTIIRSADAFGARAVILTGGCVDPYNPKVVRATTGSVFHLPVIEAEWEQIETWLDREEVSLYASDIDGRHQLGKIGIPNRIAFAIGNESRGLPERVLQTAVHAVKIPMIGSTESLNAAVSAGILLYEAQRHIMHDPD